MSCGVKESLVFTLGLITGTGTTLTGKVLYGVNSTGLDGQSKLFEKPIFQTWAMFLAMIFALPIHWLYQWHVDRTYHKEKALNKRKTKAPRIPVKIYFSLLFPAAFDLIATFLANIGLLYVTVSVFQLMKCTVIIFVALLKVTFLRESLTAYMWVGIALNTIAVLMVGATSFGDVNEQTNNKEGQSPFFGIMMIVISCLVQSCQYVYEEKLMDEVNSAPPLVVVGMEGVWGFLLTSLVVYPIAFFVPGNDLGSNERFDDALTMLQNSTLAQSIFALYIIVILGYNVFAVSVTYLLDSIWHAILDNFRPITVWGVDLLLFYIFTHKQFGEAWTAWSWLQLGGMLFLLVGTAVYNGTIRLSGCEYLEPEESALTPIRTPLGLSSSAMSRSPLISKNAMKAADIARKTPNAMDRARVREEFLAGEGNTAGNKLKVTADRRSYGSFEA